MMHAYAYANANAMQLRTKHLKCYSGYLNWLSRNDCSLFGEERFLEL
jgi:hypothetical protein